MGSDLIVSMRLLRAGVATREFLVAARVGTRLSPFEKVEDDLPQSKIDFI